MTTQRPEGAPTPRNHAVEPLARSEGRSEARSEAASEATPEASPASGALDRALRSPHRKRLPSSYRVIMEPRKAKSASLRERRPARIGPDEERESPSSRMPITLPSMRIVLTRPPAPQPPPAAAVVELAAPPPPAVQIQSADSVEPKAGDHLADRYRLVERIGLGGMGAVWRARSAQLDLDVAVKLIRRDCTVPDARERLLREARLAARVVHPASVRIFDCAVTAAGDPFVVMELLKGKSLSRSLADNGPMSAILAVQLMLPIISALAVAHRENVIHRDVKPANILLIEDNRRITPKLIDYGIACNAPGSGARRLTAHNVALGSLEYMAPEQLRRGGEPDPRCDVWGVCTTLFELVSGERPSPGQNPSALLADVQPGQPPRADVFLENPRFWSIVARGLSRAPEARWPTMGALGSALAEWGLRTGALWDINRVSLAVHCSPAPEGDLPG